MLHMKRGVVVLVHVENRKLEVAMVGVHKRAKNRMIAVNERGHAIGESHPRAILTDHDVGLVMELLDDGYSYGWIAGKMEVSKSCIAHIAKGRTRSQIPADYRRRIVSSK